MTLPPIFCGGPAADQPAFFEIAQQPAEIAGVKIERTRNIGCREFIVSGQLV